MLKLLRRLMCRHFWINILRLGGEKFKPNAGLFRLKARFLLTIAQNANAFGIGVYDGKQGRSKLWPRLFWLIYFRA